MQNIELNAVLIKLLIHSQTSTMQPLKFGNEWIISSHTVLGVWFIIHTGINVNLFKLM